jgi:hypothetical protein
VSPVDPTLVRLVGYLALFWPTVGYYVYDDSRRRGHARPLARGVLIGALGIVGVFVHLRTRNDRPD